VKNEEKLKIKNQKSKINQNQCAVSRGLGHSRAEIGGCQDIRV
jgi:hypothetical protein